MFKPQFQGQEEELGLSQRPASFNVPVHHHFNINLFMTPPSKGSIAHSSSGRGQDSQTCIILNPKAKSARAASWKQKVHKAFPSAMLMLTERAGHAEELAREAVQEGFKTVVAAGGDGTVNEVVNGLASSEEREQVQLGILPIGSVNVFAMELGIPNDFQESVKVIRNGKGRWIDLAKANERYFIQLAGVGFDAAVIADTDWESKKCYGPLSYVFTATALAGKKAPKVTVREVGKRKKHSGSFVLVGNGRLYGGPFQFFPEASLRDGCLDVCVFKNQTYIDLLRYFHGMLMGGSHTLMEDVTYFKAEHIRVESAEKGQEIPVEVDGELVDKCPVVFSVQRKALNVLTPRDNPGKSLKKSAKSAKKKKTPKDSAKTAKPSKRTSH